MAASLAPCFTPTTVAVIGAGRDGGVGAAIVANLATTFRGQTFPINRHATAIGGLPCYPSIAATPAPVDLAVIAVPAAAVEAAVDDCIAAGVRAVVVISAGFAETGAEGRRREAALLATVRRAGLRMIGPNCLGIINTDPAVRLNASFAAQFPPPGSVALASQSGALGLAVLDAAARSHVGISSFASIGNSADVSLADLVDYWATDAHTRVILLYAESLDQPRRLADIAQRVGRSTPIVALKSGRSASGARAASSHTGAMARSDRLVDALFREAGIVRTDSIEDLLGAAAVLADQPLPRGNRVAILTNAGGPAILAADAGETRGLRVAALSAQTTAALRAFLPPQASVTDPIDMIATASPADYSRAMALLLADPNIDALIVIGIAVRGTDILAVARAVAAAARDAVIPVVATFLGAEGAAAAVAPVPCYTFPEAAVLALCRAWQYASWRARPIDPPPPPRPLDRARIADALTHVGHRGGGWLDPAAASTLVEACGLHAAPTRVVSTPHEAIETAGALGYPVVLKGTGPALLHKTESHAVFADLRDQPAMLSAFATLAGRRDVETIVMQPLIPGGVEMFVGAVRDDAFGHVVMCGSGGILVEWLGDVTRRLAPVGPQSARDMIDEIRGATRLRGFRGAPPLDEAAFADVILAVSALVDARPDIAELDFNPVIVQREGAVIVDARIRVAQLPSYP